MRPRSIFVLMKPLAESKSRLEAVLSARERSLLSLCMLGRVLRAATAAAGDAEVCLVGGDASVRELATRAGAAWRQEPARGLNPALRRLLGDAAIAGRGAVYLPADLPLIGRADVEELFAAAPRQLAIAPDRHEQGTNAFAVPSGAGFEPELGEGSFARHLAQAQRLGLEVAVCRAPGLLLDIDTADDLAALLALEPGFWAHAAAELAALGLDPDHTAAALEAGHA